jgi:Copper type II ascorbate-dependent monooxygenase, N-terminal domain/Copper type II ascorbate-dependent monooxygenase, C-terminal domain
MTRMRRPWKLAALAGAVLALGLPLAALAAARGHAASPSFERDVAPILQAKCEGCHRIGGIAPFALATRHDVKTWAPVLATAVRSRVMPPWPPGPRSPQYVGEDTRKLSAAERAKIVDWVRAGAKVDGPPLKPLPAAPIPVRAGESVLRVAMPATYRPTSRNGASDDYRCFLLDPKLTKDVFVTSARIQPGATRVVHHVILFKETPAQAADARRLDAASPGLGWSCFGGTGVSIGSSAASVQSALNDANWISAWAPGWGGGRLPDGNGVPLSAGSQIVMQVHYNLLNGRTPDRSQAVLTVAPASANLTPMQTMLLPAPVELACARSEHGPLCNRQAALENLVAKYGSSAGIAPAGLLLLCGKNAANPRPSPVTTCDRRIDVPTKILVVAGHMHLLGSSINLTLNPGTPRARVLLDIPHWNFHWQNAYTLATPVEAEPGDIVRVTCHYDVGKRLHLGTARARTPRYVLWGEGTTDEMCLGILQVTHG